MSGMDLASAIRHLRQRLATADAAPSKNRPHWSISDMEAVAALVDIPASAEQIALARIEGRASNGGGFAMADTLRDVLRISREGLGLRGTL